MVRDQASLKQKLKDSSVSTETKDTNLLQRLLKKPRREVYVFLITLLIATSFWLLNALSKDYSITVSVPLKYVNIPGDLVVTNRPPSQLLFSIKGDGYNLLPVDEVDEMDSIEVDCSRMVESYMNGQRVGIISAQPLTRQVSRLMGARILVHEVSQDTILLRLDERMTKTLPVRPVVYIEVADQHIMNPQIGVTPITVELTGPAQQLNKMEAVSTQLVSASGVTGPLQGEIGLDLDWHVFEASESVVEYEIEVEQITEVELRVPIAIRNMPEGVHMNLYPSAVDVTCQLGLSKYELIDANDFYAWVDYEQVKEGQAHQLIVQLDRVPEFARVVRYDPLRVEFIVRTPWWLLELLEA